MTSLTDEQIDEIRRQVWDANRYAGVIEVYRIFARAVLQASPIPEPLTRKAFDAAISASRFWSYMVKWHRTDPGERAEDLARQGENALFASLVATPELGEDK